MTIGEVCLLTNDVPRLAAFYKQLLGVENGSNDETHQFIIPEGPHLVFMSRDSGLRRKVSGSGQTVA